MRENHLGRVKQFDTESIDGSSHKRVGRGIVIAGVDDAVEIGLLLLDGLDGAPEDSLSAAAVVGVGVEEAYGPLSVSPTSDHRYGE